MSASSMPSSSMALIVAAERERSVNCADMSYRHVLTGLGPAIQAFNVARLARRDPGSKSRRLLCVHFLDGAGLEVDLDAVDLFEIGPGHADEARFVRIVNRVNGAILIDAGFAGREPVLPD